MTHGMGKENGKGLLISLTSQLPPGGGGEEERGTYRRTRKKSVSKQAT